MITIYLNQDVDEPARRESIYSGDFHLITGNPASLAMVDFARELIADAFGDLDPEKRAVRPRRSRLHRPRRVP